MCDVGASVGKRWGSHCCSLWARAA